MRPDGEFDQRYIDGDLPWDTGRPDRQLARVIEAHGIEPCAALEIGCGTGANAVWLAGRGFRVTAVDISPNAVRMAERKARAAGVQVAVLAADFMAETIPGGPFGLVFDRGVLHGYDEAADRAEFAERVAAHLEGGGGGGGSDPARPGRRGEPAAGGEHDAPAPGAILSGAGGLRISLVGSTDGPPRAFGPPRRSAADVALAVEPHFEVLVIEAGHFDSDQPVPAPAWSCLMRRRQGG